MKLFLNIILIFIACFTGVSQNRSTEVNKNVKLKKWSSQDCDNTYDPNRLVTRITNIVTTDTSTSITINFSENCCVEFKPGIEFHNNKLVLLPYKEYSGNYCGCDCCFSIQYEISGLIGKNYEIYFRDKKVILSQDHYSVTATSSELYNGQQINRKNKYGFKEGIWMSFHKNGQKKNISQYPEVSLYHEPLTIWSKDYYPSGKLSAYDRKDTTESWFEDGEIKSQFIEYKSGDTAYKKGFRKFENRFIQKEYIERSYPTVIKSEFDPEYETSGSIYETIYKKEYFSNGKPQYIFGKDTSYSWFETGILKLKRYHGDEIEFDENGKIKEQSYSWMERGPKSMGDLSNNLYVSFYPNGNIKQIRLSRDEPYNDGIAPGVGYDWIWDKNMKLIESPKNWKEVLPWKRFKEINLSKKSSTIIK